MSNPDIQNTDMRMPSLNSLYIAFPISIIFVLLIITFFYLKNSSGLSESAFWMIFRTSIPLAAIVITGVANIIIQYTTCNTTDIGKALLGTIPTLIAIIIGFGISSISYCRIPIASLFAPLFMGKTVNVVSANTPVSVNDVMKTNTKECCSPKLTLRKIEEARPILLGFSYSFYTMFSILFGMVIGTGMSRIC